MMKKILLLTLLAFLAHEMNAQEFICQVSVSSPQVQGTDRSIYETLQRDLYEFVNNKKWSNYIFKQEEKIECSLMINIADRISNDEFKGTMTIQLRRPIYRTTYNSPVINYVDKDIQFKYIEGQNIEYSDNTFSSNITSLVAYYLYVFLGLDFDTYSQFGGSAFYEKAQSVVNTAQSTPERGWKAFESLRNRYWLVENLTNSAYSSIREALYQYHRMGLDVMTDNMEIGRTAIMESLELLRKANREKPGLFLLQIVLEAKKDELVNIFSQASAMDKARAVNILKEIDPSNGNTYQKILESK